MVWIVKEVLEGMISPALTLDRDLMRDFGSVDTVTHGFRKAISRGAFRLGERMRHTSKRHQCADHMQHLVRAR